MAKPGRQNHSHNQSICLGCSALNETTGFGHTINCAQLGSSDYFVAIVFQFCSVYHVEFLPWRCWIGFWVMLILFGVVAMEGCFLVRYFTRFTEEIFACLISAIFIYEAIHFLEVVRP